MSEKVTRRRALTVLAGFIASAWSLAVAALTGLFVTTPWRNKGQVDETLLGRISVYGPEYRVVRMRVPVQDGWFRHIDHKIVYVRIQEDGEPFVLAGTCSHLACTVNWNDETHEFVCPCHGGRFADDGRVLSGPPPTGLERLSFEVRDSNIYIRFPA